MCKQQKISVIMSVYNEQQDWLVSSIESIINQTFSEFEFLIVLDNPNNYEAKQIVEAYAKNDKRITVIYNEQNIGLVKSLNKAIKYAKGEYIARMDSDDISHVDRLEIQYSFFEKNPNIDLIASYINYIDENGIIIKNDSVKEFSVSEIRIKQIFENYLPHPTWMFKKNILSKLIEYRNVPLAEDYDFTCRALIYGYNVAIIPKTLLDYRVRVNSITQTNGIKQYFIADIISKNYRKAIVNNKKYFPYEQINNMANRNNFNKIYRGIKRRLIKYKKILFLYYYVKDKELKKFILSRLVN